MMKKILCTLALTLMAFMTHAQMLPETGASRIAAASTKTGDVNGDYKVAIDDVTMIISYLIEQAGNNFIVSNADANHDGVITISDVVATAMLVFEGDKPKSYLSCPDNNHPHLIDLGLPSGTLWSCCNVGANKPEAYGGYYAWGETEEKAIYDWSTYIHCSGTKETCYNLGSDIAGTQYDVAHVKWGESWVMPSENQIQELRSCNSIWTNLNGVDGRRYTGSNGGSIFLPAAGYRWMDYLGNVGSFGGYWSSAQDPSYSHYACILRLTSNYSDTHPFYTRSDGHSVRPVYVGNTTQPLVLSINSVEMYVGESATVEITSGNGSYTVSSSATNVATVSLSGMNLNITGVAIGSAVVTVTDTSTSSSLDISVTVVNPSCPDNNHPHFIDLGLPSGTLWACCNVGATKPESYGGYYAWGETEEKSYYDWSTYIHCDGSSNTCHNLGSDIAGTQYDVAHVKWGDTWQMPTFNQMSELGNYCSSRWINFKGVNGRRVVGSNGNSIFLPAAGYQWAGYLYVTGSGGHYWSSAQHPYSGTARKLYFSSNAMDWTSYFDRNGGLPVRPIYVGSTFKPLALSMNSVEIEVGEDATVEITSGNGSYTVGSSRTNVATTSLSGTTITILGVAAGSAVVTATDTTTGNSLTISVTVTAAKPQSYLACPDSNHPHMIDLGLPSGTLWACCNVGADKPEAYGGYYAWGETEEKTTYSWNTYIHCDGSSDTCYNLGSDIAGTQYDVAHVKWGGSWVMPSYDQNKELIENCNHEWTTMNGVDGRKFTSKKNGGTIFLPAAGHRWNDGLSRAGSYGNYWSSTQYPSYSYSACNLYFTSSNAYRYSYYGRYYGHTVRPVSSN